MTNNHGYVVLTLAYMLMIQFTIVLMILGECTMLLTCV